MVQRFSGSVVQWFNGRWIIYVVCRETRDEGRVPYLPGRGGGGRVGRLVGCSGVRMLACVVRVSFASVGYIYIIFLFLYFVCGGWGLVRVFEYLSI